MNVVSGAHSKYIRNHFQLTRNEKVDAVIQLASGTVFMCLSIPFGVMSIGLLGRCLIQEQEIHGPMYGIVASTVLVGFGFEWSRDAIAFLFLVNNE